MRRTLSSRLQILAAALALAGVGLSAWASSALVKPANVGARTGDGAATLSWDAVAGATGYQYRQRKAEDDAYGSWIPTATSTATTHTVRPLHNGGTYSFQVRAARGAVNGPASDAVTTTLLTAPAGLTASPGDGRVTLAWQAVAGATGYQHRKRKSHDADHEAWAAIATATSTTHAVTPLRNGTAYSFQVRAVRGADRGPASAEAAATPFAPCGGESVNADLAGDCETLLAAKATLDPGGSLNWARSRALGEWHGVTVSAGRVTQLNCPAGGLAGGQLADSLGQLTGLTRIQLNVCGLKGGIPSSLASLRDLEELSAYGNDLSGGIPDLRRLSKLKTLWLPDNKLSGPIPPWLGSLVNLEWLSLGGNDFIGGLPALGSLVKLKSLRLHDLNLDAGPIPAWMGRLVNLEDLIFGDSNRTGAVPSLDRLTKLRRAWLPGNKLTDISALAPLVSLEVLVASGNNLSGAIPDFSRLSKLWKLAINDNNLSGGIPDLRRLSSLKWLDLGDNKLSGPVPPWLGSLVNLRWLLLGGNDLRGGLPALGGLVKLKWLDLGDLDLSAGPIPPWVATLVNLEHMDFGDSNRTGAVPSLGRLTKLRGVYVEENELTDISALAPLVNLEELSAYDNNLSGAIPDLGRLSKLKVLWLSNNKLSGPVPTWLGSLVNLETLDLGKNDFSGGLPALGSLVKLRDLRLNHLNLDAGPIPAWMGRLVNLESLIFGDSNRTGAVPPLDSLTKLRRAWLPGNKLTDISALAPLVNLEVLVANGNNLSGAIPDFSRLSKLWKLAINDNNLSGPIPDLRRLSSLKWLDLGDNKLIGPVPTWLGSLVNLRRLLLGGNDLRGGLPALGGLAKLKWLYLNDLDLSAGPIPPWVATLVDLEHLDFGNSNRTGTVPPLGRLTKLQRLDLEDNSLTGCIPVGLASHISTINPQKNSTNLSLCAASDATPLASDAIVPAVAVAARDERATRQGLSRVIPLTPSPRRHGRDNGRARWPAPGEAAFGVFRPETPNPMPDLYLAPSGESVALALSCFLPVDRLGARPYAAHAATSTATELATAATAGDLLILTPNRRGLEGELAVVVTWLGRQGGASARLRVVVRSHAPPDDARWRVSAPGAACATTAPGRTPISRFPG